MTLFDLIAIAAVAALCGFAVWKAQPAPPPAEPEVQDDPFLVSLARWREVMARRNGE